MTYVALQIIRGVPTIYPVNPAATVYPQEAPLEVIDLLNAGGFSVGNDGWVPGIPALKNNGVRLDNPMATGSMILGGADGNVTESIRLNTTEVDLINRYALESKLARFRQYILDFQITPAEFQPVYLCWQAPGAPGPQYALIINLEIAGATDTFTQGNYAEINLTVEREPYWRPIPPGVHPRVWTAYRNNGAMYDPSFPTENLIDENVYNYTSTPLNAQTVGIDHCRKAYVDIEAEDIPGDAPALVTIEFRGAYNHAGGQPAGVLTKVMVSRYSRPTSYTMPSSSPYQMLHTNTLQSNPAELLMRPYTITLLTDAAVAADDGGRGRKATCASADVDNRVSVSFATTATDAFRLRWGISPTVMSGRYAAFLRGGQRSGSFGDQSIYLRYGYGGDDAQTDPVSPELTDAAPSEFWGMTYLGTVDIPTGKRKIETGENFGLLAANASNFNITLWALRSTGTSTLYIQDLVLMPIDETTIELDSGEFPNLFFTVGYYDSSGYALHGALGDVAYGAVTTPEMRGTELNLKPGTKNRLYFLFYSYPFQGTVVKNRSSVVADPGTANEIDVSVGIKVNIVPRWRGVRSV